MIIAQFTVEDKLTIFCAIGPLLLLFPSCARNYYHLAADRDTCNVLLEKTSCRPWYLPDNYSVNADPRSRLFDPSNPDDPMLPYPGPYLYCYQLPQLSEPSETATEELAPLPPPLKEASSPQMYADVEEGLTIQPIPPAYWDALPRACLSRMLEFESVREEYRRTFKTDPPEALRDQSPKLTFSNIVELAYLNSREYQAQKETLYSAALALTLERYDYMCKFSAAGNGVDVNYDHARTDGVEVNTLSVPSSLQADRMVALGGTFVARFANNVVLTFNGPQGFAKDISSNMLFEFTQSVFQRDVLLEPLIQSERNVVYAGRNFARFRKQFFFNLAQMYYEGLLSTYRGIEIDTENYFAFVRALDQAEAEVRSGVGNAPPRFQIDQIEQNMLGGRRSLINSCNSLETSLDSLKLTLGLPTETPINIDLRELETLTRRDEIEVAGELIRRARERVDTQLSNEIPDREEILSAAIVLLERILDWLQLRRQIGQEGADDRDIRVLRARLRADETYEALDRAQRQLALMKRSVPPTVPINVFRGTMNSVQARLELLTRQLQLADELAEHTDRRHAVLEEYLELRKRTDAIRARVARALRSSADEDLGALLHEAEALMRELEALDAPARRMIRAPAARPDAATELQQTMRQTQQLLETTDRLASDAQAGLTPVDLSVDDAMVTALVQRFDLMNERGFLADDWRNIKLAADELKSVLNLNVQQSFQTRNNRPFAFSFDDSTTQLRGSFDLPLNRRQQRNAFRQSLINYQAGRRGLMALEDDIKFETRQDLRQLDLDRIQYDIAVVSAALASERVYSTQLELALGLGSITARDFLEAQRAYRDSVNNVANGRLGYIVKRAQLALDLELMMLDDAGVWPELNNEDYQPNFDPIYPAGAGPTYGDLPCGVWPSKKIKRMLCAPLPGLPCNRPGRHDQGDGAGMQEPVFHDGDVIPEGAEVVPAPQGEPIRNGQPP